MTSITTAGLSCLNSVKRGTETTDRPAVPSIAVVSASFDRSGSMYSMGSAPKEALLDFIKDRRADAANNNSKITVTITTFDDRVERLFDNEPIENVTMTEAEAAHFINPRGGTRLIATAIEEVACLRRSFAKLKADNPNTVVTALYLLFTDGYDNESQPLTSRDLNTAIRMAQDEGITCIFAGADQDAISNGTQYGFSPATCLRVSSSPITAAAGFRSCSQAMSRAVSGAPPGFTSLERATSQHPEDLTPPTFRSNSRFQTVSTYPVTDANVATNQNWFLAPPSQLTRS